jgi:hypothetical protein
VSIPGNVCPGTPSTQATARCPGGGLLTGIYGRYGAALDNMAGRCRDYSVRDQILSQTMTPGNETVKCCLGVGTNPGQCGEYSPRSPACDKYMAQYCQANAGRNLPECSCIGSIQSGRSAAVTMCTDATCENQGYKTALMPTSCDVNSINCTQYINLDPLSRSNIVDHSSLDQRCSINSNSGDSSQHTTTTPSPPPLPSGLGVGQPGAPAANNLIMLLIVVILVVGGIIIALLVSSGDDDGYDYGYGYAYDASPQYY